MNGQGIAQFIPLVLIFVIFYFFLIRPQQKRVKEHKSMVETLKRGDEIITSGGIIGTVDRVMEDDTIEVTLAENVKVKIIRSTITSLLKQEIKKWLNTYVVFYGEFENEKMTKKFNLPERGFEPQIFSNFPAHDLNFHGK